MPPIRTLLRAGWACALGALAANAAHAQAPATLCSAPEVAVFNCHSRGKTASVCASPDLAPGKGTLQYRFGSPAQVELQYPSRPSAVAGHFFASATGFSGGGESRLRFRNGNTDYILYERTVRTRFDGKGNAPQSSTGLAVRQGGKLISQRTCTGSALLNLPANAIPEEDFDYDAIP